MEKPPITNSEETNGFSPSHRWDLQPTPDQFTGKIDRVRQNETLTSVRHPQPPLSKNLKLRILANLVTLFNRLDLNKAYFYAPNFEKVGDILVSACPYVCMYVRTYSCSRYSLETSCMDSSWKNSRRVFLVFPELSSLVKLRPFDKQGDEIL